MAFYLSLNSTTILNLAKFLMLKELFSLPRPAPSLTPSPSISPPFTSISSAPVASASLNPNPSSFPVIHLPSDPLPAPTTQPKASYQNPPGGQSENDPNNTTIFVGNLDPNVTDDHPSKFSDIYDEEYFGNILKNDVRVVEKIPEHMMERFGSNMTNVFNFRIKAWSSIQYYRDVVLPKLLEEWVIQISPFANRLLFDAPPAVQRLRCLANYEALRFSSPILSLSESLVARMRKQSIVNGGKYVSIHLRFEEDMVAFSCCVFDGGRQEKDDMVAARERGWKGKFTKPERVICPGAIRINGKCPLTPLEVGLMLRGMGFTKNTSIYLASGKIYNAEITMAPLREMFPNLHTKETLASEEELAPFKNYSSRMAAIDYTVCLHSEVFVTTQGGNFPHFLLGHRRYLYGGHSKTIKPDKRKLALLFDSTNIGWRSLKRQLLSMRSHSDSKGIELKRPSDSIYSFPCPDCMCHTNRTVDSKSSSAT